MYNSIFSHILRTRTYLLIYSENWLDVIVFVRFQNNHLGFGEVCARDIWIAGTNIIFVWKTILIKVTFTCITKSIPCKNIQLVVTCLCWSVINGQVILFFSCLVAALYMLCWLSHCAILCYSACILYWQLLYYGVSTSTYIFGSALIWSLSYTHHVILFI